MDYKIEHKLINALENFCKVNNMTLESTNQFMMDKIINIRLKVINEDYDAMEYIKNIRKETYNKRYRDNQKMKKIY